MAIGKSNVGGGFKGTAKYILEKSGAEFLYARGVVGQDPNVIASQMRAVADMRRIKSPVMHISISLKIGERGSNEQWQKAADACLEEMGFDLNQSQYIVARHTDAAHDHIHILVNRVQLNNTVVREFQHKRRTFEATRCAEKAAGFTAFESKKDRHVQMLDTREKIDSVLTNSHINPRLNNYESFKADLAKMGIEVVENRSKSTGRLAGISYKTSEHHFKGSALGKAYSLHGIEKRILDQLQNSINPLVPNMTTPPAGAQSGGGITIGGGTNLARNLRKGREGLGLTQGQKDRIRKESSHEL